MENPSSTTLSGINRCPEDVIRLTFQLLNSPRSSREKFLPLTFILSHVCQKWRAIAFDMPQLWSRIRLHIKLHQINSITEFLSVVIERVRRTPVELTITGVSTDIAWSNLRNLQLNRFSNIRKISLWCGGQEAHHRYLLGENSVLARCNPEELELGLIYRARASTWKCSNLLNQFPSIRRLSLYQTYTIQFDEMEPIEQITSLSLSDIPVKLQHIFLQFPRLEELTLRSIDIDGDDTLPPMITLENLTRLHVTEHFFGDGDMLGDWLEHLSCPRLQELSIQIGIHNIQIGVDKTLEFLSRTQSLRFYKWAYPDILLPLSNVAPHLEHLMLSTEGGNKSLLSLANAEPPIFPRLRILEIEDTSNHVNTEEFDEIVRMRCLPASHSQCKRPERVVRLERLEFMVSKPEGMTLPNTPWMASRLYTEAEKATFDHENAARIVVRLWWNGQP